MFVRKNISILDRLLPCLEFIKESNKLWQMSKHIKNNIGSRTLLGLDKANSQCSLTETYYEGENYQKEVSSFEPILQLRL